MEGVFSIDHSRKKYNKKKKLETIRNFHLATADNDLQKLKAKLIHDLKQAGILYRDDTLNFRQLQVHFLYILNQNYKKQANDDKGFWRVQDLTRCNIVKLFLHYDIKCLEFSGLSSKNAKVHRYLKKLIFDFLKHDSHDGNFLKNLYPPFYQSMFAAEMHDIRSKDQLIEHMFEVFFLNYNRYVQGHLVEFDYLTIIDELRWKLKTETDIMDPHAVDLIHELNMTKSMQFTLQKNFNGPMARRGQLNVGALLREPIAIVFALLHAQQRAQALLEANTEIYSKIKDMILKLIKISSLDDLSSPLANVPCVDETLSAEEAAAVDALMELAGST